MNTKYEEQIKKYGIITVDNRLAHDFRVCSARSDLFDGYVIAMKKKLCSRVFMRRCDELMLALNHVRQSLFSGR